MPPKSSKAKARAAARAEKREAKKGANGGDDDEQNNIKLGEDQADTSKGSEDIGDSTDAESEGGFEDAQGGEEDGLQRSRSQQNADAEQEEEEEEEEKEEEEGAGSSEDKEAASAQGENVAAEEAGDAGTAASVDEAGTDAVDQASQEHTGNAAAAQTTTSELAEDTTAAEKGNEKPAMETIVTPPEATESTGATPATGAQQRPPPPPPPPRPNVDTSQTGPAAASSSSDASRARSQSSLWDRLRSPAEKATQSSGAGSLLSPDTDSGGSPSVPRRPSATSNADGNTPPSRRPSYMPASSGFFSSLTSAANFAATSAASRGFALPERLGGGSASAAAAGSAERKRLPRHQVDEAKMMEDQMRFAEARHVLATSKDPENIRKLGKDLEEGWREKLREVTELHLSLEDLAASVSDIQDENEHLRAQMAQLSEQIALREEDFEGFQRLTVAHQQREKELWKAEGIEERERLEWKEREAVRILAEERAINAQLRLVLMSTLKDGGASGLISGGSMVTRSRDSGNEAEQPSDQTPNSSRRNTMMSGSSGALFDNSYDSEQSSPSQELSRPGAGGGSSGGGGGAAGEEGESIQDDVLFNLNLPHAQNQGGSQGGSSQGARGGGGGGSDRIRPTSSLFSDVMPLDQLKLLLRIDDGPADGSDGRGNIDAVLPSVDAQRHNGNANGAIKGNRSGGSPSSQAMDRTLSPSAASSTSSSAANYQPSSSTSLESHLVAAKGIADYQLSQTLQLENLSLRSRLKDEQRQKGELESEVKVLKDKVAGMEEALGALLEQTGGS